MLSLTEVQSLFMDCAHSGSQDLMFFRTCSWVRVFTCSGSREARGCELEGEDDDAPFALLLDLGGGVLLLELELEDRELDNDDVVVVEVVLLCTPGLIIFPMVLVLLTVITF